MAQGVDGAFLSQCYDKPVMVRAGDVVHGDAPWVKVSGMWKDISLWGDENFVAVDVNGHVYKRVAGQMTQVEGVLETVISDGAGSMWWGINGCGQLYKCDGHNSVSVDGVGIWTNVANDTIRARSIVLDRGASKLYVLTRVGHVWVHDIETGHWTHVTPMGPLAKAHKLVMHFDNTVVHIDTSREMWYAKQCWTEEGVDVTHWEWKRLNDLTDIESGCAGACNGEERECLMYGIDSHHVVREFTGSWRANKPVSTAVRFAGRARVIAHHKSTLAYITDGGEMYWRPRV